MLVKKYLIYSKILKKFYKKEHFFFQNDLIIKDQEETISSTSFS